MKILAHQGVRFVEVYSPTQRRILITVLNRLFAGSERFKRGKILLMVLVA